MQKKTIYIVFYLKCMKLMCMITIMSTKERNSSKVIEFNAGRQYGKSSIWKIYKIKFIPLRLFSCLF